MTSVHSDPYDSESSDPQKLEISPAFEPDGDRARAMDARMRAQLAESLEYLAAEIATQQPDTQAARHVPAWYGVIDRLRNGDERASPTLFSAYFQLVLALTTEDADRRRALEDLKLAARLRPVARLRRFADETLGGARVRALYRRALDTDVSQPAVFQTPSPEAARRYGVGVERALRLMRVCAPGLADEFDALIGEIVLAAGNDDANAMRFDGASSYQLWGALTLNVDETKTDLEMMEALAHEAGHSFLFGMTVYEPLVLNDDGERFPSPLRPDPRPMDGIYHATWVSARMHYAVRAARDADTLTAAQFAECDALLQASRRAFADGDSVVQAHGRLSVTGAALLDHARRFIRQTA